MIIFGSQEGTDAFEPQIAKLLEILGHPEALVTDNSQFLDFICMFEYETLSAAQVRLNTLLKEGGVTINIDVRDTLLKACRRITAYQPGWPNPPCSH